MRKIVSNECTRRLLKPYLESFNKSNWKIVCTMCIDLVYLILIILILMFVNAKWGYYTQAQILPMAKEVGNIKNIQANAINNKIDITQLKKSSNKIEGISIGLKDSLSKFLVVIISSILLIILFTTLSKTLVWSLIKGSFKGFKLFMYYNVIYVLFTMIIVIGSLFLIKSVILPQILLLYCFAYIYLSIVFSSKFNPKLPLFLPLIKQYFSSIKFSIIYFYKILIPIIFIIITGLICVGIILLSGYLFPIFITSILMILLALFFMSWFRLYMYECITQIKNE